MVKRREKLTEAEKEQAQELADKGWTFGRVAVELGRQPGSLQYYFCEWGLLPLKNPVPVEPVIYMRNGKPVRRFTVAEDNLIERLSMEGKGLTEIGKIVDRPINSIRARLSQLAATEEAKAA